MFFKEFAKNAASAGFCLLAKCYLNQFLIKEYGKMLTLEIDPEKKKIQLEVLLNGETESLHVSVGRYECIANNGDSRLMLKEITTSRQWLNVLLENKFPEGLLIPINGQTASMVNGIL